MSQHTHPEAKLEQSLSGPMPIYLDDLREGIVWVSQGRTVTEADIVNFAGLSGDYNRLHTDEPWVRENTPFAGRIAHGLLVTSITSGQRTPGLDDLALIAYLEMSRRMSAPTYPGDTLTTTNRVISVRRSRSRPDTGIVTLDIEVHNQRDEVVQGGQDVLLVAARGDDA